MYFRHLTLATLGSFQTLFGGPLRIFFLHFSIRRTIFLPVSHSFLRDQKKPFLANRRWKHLESHFPVCIRVLLHCKKSNCRYGSNKFPSPGCSCSRGRTNTQDTVKVSGCVDGILYSLGTYSRRNSRNICSRTTTSTPTTIHFHVGVKRLMSLCIIFKKCAF